MSHRKNDGQKETLCPLPTSPHLGHPGLKCCPLPLTLPVLVSLSLNAIAARLPAPVSDLFLSYSHIQAHAHMQVEENILYRDQLGRALI